MSCLLILRFMSGTALAADINLKIQKKNPRENYSYFMDKYLMPKHHNMIQANIWIITQSSVLALSLASSGRTARRNVYFW